MSANQFEQQRRALASRLVETIVNDPSFRQQLIDDSKGALEAHGMWDEYVSVNQALESPDVAGYALSTKGSDSNCCGSNY